MGGAVRDTLMGRMLHDRDYVVCGMTDALFHVLFPQARAAGKSFPVYLLKIDGAVCEVAFARHERKSGKGYKGFVVTCAPDITIEEDLYRRDTTINSMAIDENGVLIDPYGGERDLKLGVIRAVSEHFREDPVRALRAARQSAQFGFSIERGTVEMMSMCADELRDEPRERKFAELKKALESDHPSQYFRAMLDAGLLEQEYPHIFALIGKTQLPDVHPEGDAFVHTMMTVDDAVKMTKRVEVRFAVLMHDIGKSRTPAEMLPRHEGHGPRGAEIMKEVADSMCVPRLWYKCAECAAREHMRPRKMRTPEKIRDLVRTLEHEPLRADGFAVVVGADNHGEVPAFLLEYDGLLAAFKKVAEQGVPADIKGAEIGKYLRAREIEAAENYLKEHPLRDKVMLSDLQPIARFKDIQYNCTDKK